MKGEDVVSIRIGAMFLGIGALSLSILSGCSKEVKADAKMEEQVVEVDMKVEAWGEVEGTIIKEIYVDFPATVEAIKVKEGQIVKKGEELVLLNYEPYKQTILMKEKEATLESITAEAKLTEATGQVKNIAALNEELSLLEKRLTDGEDPEILSIESELTTIVQQLEDLEEDYKVQTALLEVGGSSSKIIKGIETQKTTLQTQIDTLEAKKSTLIKEKTLELEKLKAEIANAKDGLSTTEKSNNAMVQTCALKDEIGNLELSMMRDKFQKSYIQDNAIITDIEAAIISEINVVEGSRLGEQSGSVLRLIDQNSLKITAHVPEEFIKSVAIGSKVEIVPYADKTISLSGKVTAIAGEAVKENGETVINIEVTPDEVSPYLQVGYGVDVFIG